MLIVDTALALHNYCFNMVGRKLPLPSHHNPLLEEEHTPLGMLRDDKISLLTT